MAKEKKAASAAAQPGQISPQENGMRVQEFARLQGMMLYQFMTLKSSMIPFTNEIMEMNKIGLSADPQQMLSDWTERQRSAINFQRFVGTFGKELFGSAVYEGEKLLTENELFKLTYIPAKKGVQKRASLFHLGGFVPYSDNLFRLLPKANLFDRFIENGIDVYEMKLKCDTKHPNPHLLNLSVEQIIGSVHAFSDIAFAHAGKQKMILEGYCGTGVHVYTSYLADIEGMARKFDLLLTFVSPLDARKCTIFEQMHEILNYLNPEESSVDGRTISSLLDTIQERVFEKTPMGALVHGWKNKEYAKIEKIEDLSHRQQSELAAWYWLSLEHGSYYPLSKDLYAFYSRLFAQGVSEAGVLPYEYKGRILNLNDLKKTGVKVLAFLGDKDHLVDCHTADVLYDILGKRQAEVVVHEKTGHVAYIFNPNRWDRDDPRAFKPDIFETIFRNFPVAKAAAAKPASQQAASPVKPAAPKAVKATKAMATPKAKAAVKVQPAPVAKAATPKKAVTKTQPKPASAPKVVKAKAVSIAVPKATATTETQAKPKPGPVAKPKVTKATVASKVQSKPVPKPAAPKPTVPVKPATKKDKPATSVKRPVK